MITEGIFSIVFTLLSGLLSMLPNVELVVSADMFTKFFEIIQVVCYLFPVDTVITIVGIIIALNVFRIVVSFIKTLWQLIPFL